MEVVIVLTLAGTTGTTTSTEIVTGYIESVTLTNTGQTAPTTVLSETSGPGRALLTRTTTAPTGTYYPSVNTTDTAGAAASASGIWQKQYIEGTRLTLAVTAAGAAGTITARVILSKGGGAR